MYDAAELQLLNEMGYPRGVPGFTSPPASAGHKSLKFKPIISYLGALRRGNVFLYLPRHLRDRIYVLILSEPELEVVEMPDVRTITNPAICEVSDFFYDEAMPVLVRNTTFSITSDCAVYSLMVLLSEFPKTQGFERVASLELTTLDLFERGEFPSNATALLRRCPSVKRVTLIIHLDELVFTYVRGCREVDMDVMARKFDLKTLATLENLEVLILSLKSFMALQKRIASMEHDRVLDEQMTGTTYGVESFWGLKEWIEMQFLDHMRLVDVHCPKLHELFPYGLPADTTEKDDEPIAEVEDED
ncbi:hypothetical protein BCR34DRAFT_596040 [Clohesyomyces aquaticus]|uniref:F-box domain-containing protein n=1 Tax=Clohesyomyces aquaticus TaxID=1231657 RepID=A0A1Y2AA03_9PLEO|nr:hypothetical protein BCR34DRAFT_596040 [Clohesyomyces aquaticus]